MKEIIVPLNCSPLSISIKDKHNRKIWGEEPAICTSESYLQAVITKSKHFYSYSPDHEFWPENPETQAGPIIYNRGLQREEIAECQGGSHRKTTCWFTPVFCSARDHI